MNGNMWVRMRALLLALLGMVVGGEAAQAQVISDGDLVLAFRATGGTGQLINFEVNLGNAANFMSGAASPFSSLDLSADLSNIYGNNWSSRTDLIWAVGGAVQSGNTTNAFAPATTFFSAASGTVVSVTPPGTVGSVSAPAIDSGTRLNAVNGGVQLLYTGLNQSSSLANPPVATGNTPGGYTIPSANGSSFSSNPNLKWASGAFNSENTAANTADGGNTVELYEGVPFSTNFSGTAGRTSGTLSDLGTFTLGSDGTLSYATSAVPEPSTYALIGLGGVVFFVAMLRRRTEA